jgi:hypothetical protein
MFRTERWQKYSKTETKQSFLRLLLSLILNHPEPAMEKERKDV